MLASRYGKATCAHDNLVDKCVLARYNVRMVLYNPDNPLRTRRVGYCFDFFGIGTGIAGLASAGANLLGTKWTNDTNEKIAKQNLNYQREYNQTVWQREDTNNAINRQREDSAQQRAVADARAAGLSPLAAAGVQAPSAGGTVSGGTSAPQLDYQAQAPVDFGSSFGQIGDMFNSYQQQAFQARENAENRKYNLLSTILGLAAQKEMNNARIGESARQYDATRVDNASNRRYEKARADYAVNNPSEVFGRSYGPLVDGIVALLGGKDTGLKGFAADVGNGVKSAGSGVVSTVTKSVQDAKTAVEDVTESEYDKALKELKSDPNWEYAPDDVKFSSINNLRKKHGLKPLTRDEYNKLSGSKHK